MPRRNKQQKHTPFYFGINEISKTRYPTKQAAEKTAELQMLQSIGLELRVYRGVDGGWYLTRQQPK